MSLEIELSLTIIYNNNNCARVYHHVLDARMHEQTDGEKSKTGGRRHEGGNALWIHAHGVY